MQAISNPPDCFYIFIRCNGLYFLPDIAYMHIKSLCFTHIWLIPRIFEYILLAKHLLRVFKQQFQYCEFLFCNLRKHPATDTYLKGRACKHHISELKPSAALSFLYTSLCFYFCFCLCFYLRFRLCLT